jgi:hypothetical protein
MTQREINDVKLLTEYMLAVDAHRARIRAEQAAGQRVSAGVAPEYLPALLGFVYNEFIEVFTEPLFDEKREDFGALPEEIILKRLFELFLNYLDEKDVRKLFDGFGTRPPRAESAHQERNLFWLYKRERMPPKAQFARRVADYNKTVPRGKRLGSRSTSEVNMLRYINRMLDNYREEAYLNPRAAKVPDGPIQPRPAVPFKDLAPGFLSRQIRRKMSRQT